MKGIKKPKVKGFA